MKLTEHFTLEEFIESSTAKAKGIENKPNERELASIKHLAQVLEKVRVKYGKPIKVNSGFRCAKLNAAVGGSKTSQHMKGEAADIVAVNGTNKELFDCILGMIRSGEIAVGQLIDEYNYKWVHVSIPYTKKNNVLHLK